MVCAEMSCDSLALLCIYSTYATDLACVFCCFLWSIVNLITFQAFVVLYASMWFMPMMHYYCGAQCVCCSCKTLYILCDK